MQDFEVIKSLIEIFGSNCGEELLREIYKKYTIIEKQKREQEKQKPQAKKENIVQKKPPISLQTFTTTIEKIKLFNEVDDKVNDILNKLNDDFMKFSCMYSVNLIVNILEDVFDDTEGWLSYWLWECGFGENTHEKVMIDGKYIELDTIEKLYNFLLDEKKDNW